MTIVSGSAADRAYWQSHFTKLRQHIFGAAGETAVLSLQEESPKGNYLGTLKAWGEIRNALPAPRPDVALMTMVFGQGKRLSPFTQALGNRKPAFPTPYRAGQAGAYLCSADLACLYSNLLIQQLRDHGFRGVLVKWGDEAIIPSLPWNRDNRFGEEADLVRFVWQTEPTEVLAREKDWFVVNQESGLVEQVVPRQELASLRTRFGGGQPSVNLGSLAVSHMFLETALELFGEDVANPARAADWDPYFFVALFSRTEEQWRAEAGNFERRYPGFYAKVAGLRAVVESKTGRAFRVAYWNLGEVFWMDLGLHVTLRKALESLTTESEAGRAARELFGIPHDRDRNGNIVVASRLPGAAGIRNSVILDSILLDPESVLEGAVVVGGRHRRLEMPQGGCALFSAVDRLSFRGAGGIAFRSLGEEVTLEAGGRHTSLPLPEGPEGMVSSESVTDYDAAYSQPILGNRLSFEEAARRMAVAGGEELDNRWERAWGQWSAAICP